MKLEEILPAIRKGQSFRLAGLDGLFNKRFGFSSLDIETILSEYWELEPIKKEISRKDLERALLKTTAGMMLFSSSKYLSAFDDICKELGLE